MVNLKCTDYGIFSFDAVENKLLFILNLKQLIILENAHEFAIEFESNDGLNVL